MIPQSYPCIVSFDSGDLPGSHRITLSSETEAVLNIYIVLTLTMYLLHCTDGYQYRGQEGIYVLDVFPLASGLAAVGSDQTLSLFDPSRLSQGPSNRIQTNHGNLAVARHYSAADSIVATTGENGVVSLWDLRLDPSKASLMKLEGMCIGQQNRCIVSYAERQLTGETGNQANLMSLACCSSTFTVAAGTELVESERQASVLIWYVSKRRPPCNAYSHDVRQGHKIGVGTSDTVQ